MKKLAILLALLTCGCACQNEDIPNIRVMKPTDKYLNCKNLRRELVVAKFEIRASKHRLKALPAYAKNITCMPATQLQIEKAQNMAENRVDYIETLMREKGCDIPSDAELQPHEHVIYEDIESRPIYPMATESRPVHLKKQESTPPCLQKEGSRTTFLLKKKPPTTRSKAGPL